MAFNFTDIKNLFLGSASGALNANFQAVKDEFARVFYRDGSTFMSGDLDMNSRRILNVPYPRSDNEVATLGSIRSIAAGIAKGDPGAADNTYSSFAEMQASDPTRKSARLVGDTDNPPHPDGPYSNPTQTVGGWVPQSAAGIVFQSAGTGAVVRSHQDKSRDTVNIKDFGAKGDGVTDDTPAWNAAWAYLQTLPDGGEIVFPRGRFPISMDMTDHSTGGDFSRRYTVRGAGRSVTTIMPSHAGAIMLTMLGRNGVTVSDMTFKAGDVYQATCGIYVGRSNTSQNANNNRFLNLEIAGNFDGPAVISCSAESSLWFNCLFAPGAASNAKVGFWTGDDPSLCGVTVANAISGPNTDNRMIACEFYMTYDFANAIVLSRAAGWVFESSSFIFGNVNNTMIAAIKDFNGGVFNGPIHFRDNHYEVYGTNNVGVWVAGTGIRYIYEMSITYGFAVVDSGFSMVDYNNRGVLGTVFIGGTYIAPATSSGFPNVSLSMYMYILQNATVTWLTRSGNGSVTIDNAAVKCLLRADALTVPPGNSIILQQQAAIPNPTGVTTATPTGGSTVDDQARAQFPAIIADLNALRGTVNSLQLALRHTGVIAS